MVFAKDKFEFNERTIEMALSGAEDYPLSIKPIANQCSFSAALSAFISTTYS